MQRICHSLATHGYEVILIGRQKTNSIPLQSVSFQQRRLQCWFEKGKFFYIEYNIRLFFLLLHIPFDILSSVDLDTLLPCVLVGKIRSKPCVFDAHEYFTEVPELLHRPRTKRIWTLLSNWLIPKVDMAYTVSQSLQQLFSELYNKPFHLVRNIAVTLPSTQTTISTPPVILYQGALNEGRGIEALLNAVQEIPDVLLWLAGEGDLSTALRQQTAKLQLNDRVKFWGYIPPDELKQLTLQASIGINILENKGLSYYYSLANKTFDYIHAGLPAIHSNFPEYQLLNEQFEIGVLVDDLSTYTLKTAILKLINDKAYYTDLQENCKQAAKVFNWETEEERLIELYKTVDGSRTFKSSDATE